MAEKLRESNWCEILKSNVFYVFVELSYTRRFLTQIFILYPTMFLYLHSTYVMCKYFFLLLIKNAFLKIVYSHGVLCFSSCRIVC